MNSALRSPFLCAALCAALAGAAGAQAPDVDRRGGIPVETGEDAPAIRHGFSAKTSYVGSNGVRTKPHSGNMDTLHNAAEYVATVPLNATTTFRAGASWDRIDFGSADAPLPSSLQIASAVFGVDIALAEEWGLRLETRPGFYGDWQSIGGSDFDSPTIIGARYQPTKNIDFVFGLRLSIMSEYPVLPIAGAAFRFTEKFSLDLMYPELAFRYAPCPDWSWSLGMAFKSATYQTHTSGLDGRDREFNGAIVNYSESRPQVGVVYSGLENTEIFSNAGVVLGRRFNYFRTGREVVIGGAPFIEMGARTKF